MLARHQRISRGSEFTRTLRHGVRVRRTDLMTYVLVTPTQWPDDRHLRLDVAEFGGPRVGLIVSKAVGDAVTRHAVARRLRAAGSVALDGVDTACTVVIRALPSAATVSSDVLAHQLSSALGKSGLRATVSS